jgi:hypothetical protein
MSAVLQLVIGIVFIYSLMAILVTQINAVVSSVLNLRAKNLRDSLLDLISDRRLQAEVLAHPLIKLIDPEKTAKLTSIQMDNQEAKDVLRSGKLTRVDFIPPSTFVEALVGLLTVRAYKEVEDALQGLPEDSEARATIRSQIIAFLGAPSDESLRTVYKTVNDVRAQGVMVDGLQHALKRLTDSYAEVRNRNPDLVPLLMGIRTLAGNQFQQAIQMVLFTARDATQAVGKLEKWFDDGMNRASKLFRERLQFITFISALVLVLVLNVDTLAMARAFWIDPALRESVAAAAADYVANQPDPAAEPAPVIDPNADPATVAPTPEDQLAQDVAAVRQTVDDLFTLNVPLGWAWIEADCTSTASDQQRLCESPNNLRALLDPSNPNLATLWLGKIIGLLASAIAAAQGAPFWFDFLRRLTGK